MLIASGRVEHPLAAVADGAPSTWFLTYGSPVAARMGTGWAARVRDCTVPAFMRLHALR